MKNGIGYTKSHLRSLRIRVIRVETPLGRKILREAGATVDDGTKLVKFPRALVESSLKSICRDFTLSARRPGADLVFKDGKLDGGDCVLLPDGSAPTGFG